MGAIQRFIAWPESVSTSRRAILAAVAFAGLLGAAILAADAFWRDDLPRSTIAAIALGMFLVAVLWLFGSQVTKAGIAALTTMSFVLVAAGSALDISSTFPDGPPPQGALVDCPDLPDDHGFDAVVAPTSFGYANLQREPDLASAIELRYPSDCELAFDGYCLGESKSDWRFHESDPVWFRHQGDRGFVPSADLKTGPPLHLDRLPSSECGSEGESPRRPEITAPITRRLQGPIEITVASPRALQVGFAVYYEEVPDHRRSAAWHQIAADLNPADGITAHWDTRSVPGQGRRDPASIVILAAPCLGLGFAAQKADQRHYVVANRGGQPPMALQPSPDSLDGRQEACANPER